MKTLVAAPHTERRSYAFPQWEAATASYDRLLAIEEEEAAYAATLGVPYVLFTPGENPKLHGRHRICSPLFNDAWDAILAGADGFTHVLALDTDVIPRGDILAVMEDAYDGSVCFVRHGVPWRADYHRPGYAYETSCTLASVGDWRAALAETRRRSPKATLYGTVGDPDLFTHKDINVVALDHIN